MRMKAKGLTLALAAVRRNTTNNIGKNVRVNYKFFEFVAIVAYTVFQLSGWNTTISTRSRWSRCDCIAFNVLLIRLIFFLPHLPIGSACLFDIICFEIILF